MDVLGTKTRSEREDEEAERLVRPLPKKKPPRHDRRRERMDVDSDPDIDGDKDTKRDPDLSLNRKNIGGSVSLLRVVRQAKEEEKVKVRRKKDDKIVEVSKDTLKERGGEYEVYQPKKWEEESNDFSERVKSDPAFGSRLRHILDPKSDLGGMAEGNPTFPAQHFEKNLPPTVHTLGDLRDVARELFSRPVEKPKKPKKQPKAPRVEAPHEQAEEPQQTEQEQPKQEESPQTDQAETPQQGEKSTAEGLTPDVKNFLTDLVKKSAPGSAEEKPKPDASNEKPKKDKGKPKEEESPPRRKPSKEELFEARKLVADTFPPKIAAKYIGMHPDDIHELVSHYKEFEASDPIAPEQLSEEIAKVKNWSLDPNAVPEPDKVEVNGEEVSTKELSPEVKAEALQRHRMQVIGARLAFRKKVGRAYLKAGTPPKLASHLADFMLSTANLPPEKRIKQAQEKARDLFVEASAEPETDDVEPRFGTASAPKTKSTDQESRRKALAAIKDPAAQTLAVASFQGEDYRSLIYQHLKANPISDRDSTERLEEKLAKARKFLQMNAKSYPEEITKSLEDPAMVFAVRVRHALSGMKKSRTFGKVIDKVESDIYSDNKKKYEEALKGYRASLEEWAKHHKGNPPIPPKEPRRPASYSGRSGVKSKEKMDKLLSSPEPEKMKGEGKPEEKNKPEEDGVEPEPKPKQASYSFYPSDRWQTTRANGSRQPKGRSEHTEGTMTIKFAKEDANRTLSRLDKMAEMVMSDYKKWGMPKEAAKVLVNGLDRTADELEAAVFGPESLERRQINVLKAAKVIQQDSDEKYMGTFNAPMAPLQTDADEGYMSQFADDQSQAVQSGKSSTGRPLAP